MTQTKLGEINKLFSMKSLYRNLNLNQFAEMFDKQFGFLTEYLHVVQHGGGAGRVEAVVRSADVGAGVAFAHRVNQQVAQQIVRVVVETQVLAIFCPCDLRSGDATSHTLQHQPLAFGHHDGARCRRVDDASRFRGGA